MKTSEQISQIAAALAAAQGEFKNPEANKLVSVATRDGRSYQYHYATLPSVFDATRAAMTKNGLSHFCGTAIDEAGRMVLSCRIAHKSGEWIEAAMPLPAAGDPKAMASNLSYYRRYLFCGLVGIAGDEDQDGEPEEGRKPATGQPRANGGAPSNPPKAAPGKTVTEPQLKRLFAISNKAGFSDEAVKELARSIGITCSRKDMNQAQYDQLVAEIEMRAAMEAQGGGAQ